MYFFARTVFVGCTQIKQLPLICPLWSIALSKQLFREQEFSCNFTNDDCTEVKLIDLIVKLTVTISLTRDECDTYVLSTHLAG